MKQRKTGIRFLIILLLSSVFAWLGGRTVQKEKEEFPVVDWIIELEQKDTGVIKAELNARDEAERQQEEAENAASSASPLSSASSGTTSAAPPSPIGKETAGFRMMELSPVPEPQLPAPAPRKIPIASNRPGSPASS